MMDSSLDAFQSIKDELGNRQQAVYDVVSYLGKPTNTEISKFMGLPINIITPRVNELRKKGFVIDFGLKICNVTGRKVHCWSVF